MSEEVFENTRRLIDNNSPQFELMVLAAAAQIPEFYYDHCTWVCKSDQHLAQGYSPTFVSNLHNQIFLALRSYWSALEAEPEAGAPRSIIETLVHAAGTEGRLLPSELGALGPSFDAIYAFDGAGIATMLEGEIFRYWHEKRLTTLLHGRIQMQRTEEGLSIADMSQQIDVVREELQNQHDEEGEGKFANNFMFERDDTDVGDIISTGIPELDEGLGGGFRKGEATICGAATGGGKTVMATQVGLDIAANQQKNVIFVSTEQPSNELVQRMASNYLNIPISDIIANESRTASTTKYPEHVLRAHGHRIMEFHQRFSEHIMFYDWLSGTKNILDDLDGLMRRTRRRGFAPDMLIFDWIGGALKDDPNLDYRLHYQKVADKLANMAKAENIAVFTLAQLHTQQSCNKRFPTYTMFQECKSLGNNMTNMFFISNMRASDDAEGEDNFLPTQGINIDKTRKGKSIRFPVTRDFEYQRFRTRGMNTARAYSDPGGGTLLGL